MIPWWTIPLICTFLIAAGLQLLSSDSNMPYRSLMVVGAVIVLAPILVAVWLLCFLLSLITP